MPAQPLFADCAFPEDCQCAPRDFQLVRSSCAVPDVTAAARAFGLPPEMLFNMGGPAKPPPPDETAGRFEGGDGRGIPPPEETCMDDPAIDQLIETHGALAILRACDDGPDAMVALGLPRPANYGERVRVMWRAQDALTPEEAASVTVKDWLTLAFASGGERTGD